MNRILSGVQPTGQLNIGNYLGAIRNWVRLQDDQDDYECFYCVVDLHAITVRQDPAVLRQAKREMAAAYIACGVDPQKSVIFNQSDISEHAELGWILSTQTPIGWLNRMTQFKDKAGKNKEKVGLGLYAYPVLMAADILIYQATHVPVGHDQKQHLELTRDIATKFNQEYGKEFFPIPEPKIMGEATRVMSLRDGSKKMSKSDESDNSRINLTDDADTVAKKIKKATSDPDPLPSSAEELEGRPEAKNLLTIYAAFQNKLLKDVVTELSGKQFSEFKPMLADLLIEKINPISTEMNRLLQDQAHLDTILEQGATKARSVASETLDGVYKIMGLR